MRPLLLALATALLVPATASAAPFGELPFQTLSGGAACVRATGAPAELVAWAPDGARFLRATPSGLAEPSTVKLGEPRACPAAAAQPNGAGIVAVAIEGALAVALREPGGGWGAPARVALPRSAEVGAMSVAVSERGDAVIVWLEQTFDESVERSRVRAVRRAAGGGFGAPETLATSNRIQFPRPFGAAIGGDGTAIVAWALTTGTERASHSVAAAAIGAPGAPFAAQPISSDAGTPVVAVAADGHALLAFADDSRVRVMERAPGGSFGPAQTIGAGGGENLALAVGSGGAALVAWGGGDFDDGVTYARRTDATGFAPPLDLTPSPVGSGLFGFGGSTIFSGGGGSVSGGSRRPDDLFGRDLRAAVAPDGRAVLAWGTQRSRRGIGWAATQVATVSADDAVTMQSVGGPLRDAETIAPVLLENGAPAVAWGDNGDADGRLHLAVEGAADSPQPSLQVRIGRPERTALRSRESLLVPVTCSAACDLRAEVRHTNTSASLTRAGTVQLRFGERAKDVAPLRAAPVAITVLSGPPGARAVQTQVAHPRLRRIPDPPLPRILDLIAHRSGTDVDVSWRVDRSARGVEFFTLGSSKRSENDGQPFEVVHGTGETSYHVTLHEVPPRIRYVHVIASRGERTRRAVVRIG
jgi:hypothetical protein